MLQIGFSEWNNGFDSRRDRAIINIAQGGKFIIKGMAYFGIGSIINIGSKGEFHVGDNFSCNANCHFEICNRVNIGKNVLISWNCNFIDSNFHLFNNCKRYGTINIGDDCWICCNSTILMNATINKNTVVAANSLVNKKFTDENILIAGAPAIIKNYNITWKV